MTGKILQIYLAASSGASAEQTSAAQLVAGKGIEGDHHFRSEGTSPEKQLTLVAAEEINAFNERTTLNLPPSALLRNVVTTGIDLNSLVGRHFRIGSAAALGVELCEPCAKLGKKLGTDAVPPKAIIQQLTHKAGLRARILKDGIVRPDDAIEAID